MKRLYLSFGVIVIFAVALVSSCMSHGSLLLPSPATPQMSISPATTSTPMPTQVASITLEPASQPPPFERRLSSSSLPQITYGPNPKDLNWYSVQPTDFIYTKGITASINNKQYVIYFDFSSVAVLDLKNPDNPEKISAVQIPNPYMTTGICLFNTTLYVSLKTRQQTDALLIIDISDLNHLKIISEMPTPNIYSTLYLYNNFLYAQDDNGLDIYDISNPDEPVMIKTWDGTFGYISNNLFLDLDSTTLKIQTIPTPYAPPTLLSTIIYPFPPASTIISTEPLQYSEFKDAAVIGKYIYITTYGAGLEICDIPNPENPIQVPTNLQCDGDITVAGDYAYILSHEDYMQGDLVQLKILQVSDPAHPLYIYDIFPIGLDQGFRFVSYIKTAEYFYIILSGSAQTTFFTFDLNNLGIPNN
jgi:hypothetical protein